MKKILWIVCLCLVFAYSLEVNGQTTSKGDIRFFYTKNQPRKLQIDYVSEFYFGQQSIQTIDKEYFAFLQPFRVKATGKLEKGPNFIQITDNRQTYTGWNLELKQENQFSDSEGRILDGASISFEHGRAVTNSTSELPDGKERFVLFPNESVNVLQAKEGTGEGSFQFVWGKDAEEGEKSIYLSVPGRTIKYDTNYTTNFQWILVSAPWQ